MSSRQERSRQTGDWRRDGDPPTLWPPLRPPSSGLPPFPHTSSLTPQASTTLPSLTRARPPCPLVGGGGERGGQILASSPSSPALEPDSSQRIGGGKVGSVTVRTPRGRRVGNQWSGGKGDARVQHTTGKRVARGQGTTAPCPKELSHRSCR